MSSHGFHRSGAVDGERLAIFSARSGWFTAVSSIVDGAARCSACNSYFRVGVIESDDWCGAGCRLACLGGHLGEHHAVAYHHGLDGDGGRDGDGPAIYRAGGCRRCRRAVSGVAYLVARRQAVGIGNSYFVVRIYITDVGGIK